MAKLTRSFDSSVANLRAVDDEKRTIEGYAIVFNQRSHLVYDYNLWKAVIEVISPEAVTDVFLRTQDIVANIEHDDRRMLARSDRGEGSLTLTVDTIGLKFSFDAPNTPDGQSAYEGVKRGDYKGCSFRYWNQDDECNVSYSKEIGEDGNVEIIRTVNKFDHLEDVSIVLHPAYEGTTVEARSEEKKELEKQILRALPEFAKDEVTKIDARDVTMKAQFDEMKNYARNITRVTNF